MRLILATALASLLVTPALADAMAHCAAAWKAKSADATAVSTYKAWSATCLKSDYHVSTAGSPAAPAGATAQCKDGTYSMSKTAAGRCSHHGGVAKVL